MRAEVQRMKRESAEGVVKWAQIAASLNGIAGNGSTRLGKQCRERWFNHLDPTFEEGRLGGVGECYAAETATTTRE